MKPLIISIFAIILFLVVNEGFSQPINGDIYREYYWKTEKFKVFSKGENFFEISDKVDIDKAVKAEIAIEMANEHLGFENISIRLNDKNWHPVLFPEKIHFQL